MATGKNKYVKKDPIEESKRLLKEDKTKREDACIKEFNALLKKYNCTAIIEGNFSGNQIETGLIIVSL